MCMRLTLHGAGTPAPVGSSSSPAGAAAVVDVLGEVVGNSSLVDQLEHVDLTPIADLFADVTGADC